MEEDSEEDLFNDKDSSKLLEDKDAEEYCEEDEEIIEDSYDEECKEWRKYLGRDAVVQETIKDFQRNEDLEKEKLVKKVHFSS